MQSLNNICLFVCFTARTARWTLIKFSTDVIPLEAVVKLHVLISYVGNTNTADAHTSEAEAPLPSLNTGS
jgi:hypothetical protein